MLLWAHLSYGQPSVCTLEAGPACRRRAGWLDQPASSAAHESSCPSSSTTNFALIFPFPAALSLTCYLFLIQKRGSWKAFACTRLALSLPVSFRKLAPWHSSSSAGASSCSLITIASFALPRMTVRPSLANGRNLDERASLICDTKLSLEYMPLRRVCWPRAPQHQVRACQPFFLVILTFFSRACLMPVLQDSANRRVRADCRLCDHVDAQVV